MTRIYQKIQRLNRDNQAGPLIEFSLLMPMFLLLLTAAVDVSRYIHTHQVVQHATHTLVDTLGRQESDDQILAIISFVNKIIDSGLGKGARRSIYYSITSNHSAPIDMARPAVRANNPSCNGRTLNADLLKIKTDSSLPDHLVGALVCVDFQLWLPLRFGANGTSIFPTFVRSEVAISEFRNPIFSVTP